jgi:hypothetical protein
MKNGLQTNPVMFKMILLVTCFMLAMLYNKSKAATTQQSFGQQGMVVKSK